MRLMKVFYLDEIVGYLEGQNVKDFQKLYTDLVFPYDHWNVCSKEREEEITDDLFKMINNFFLENGCSPDEDIIICSF